MGAQRAATAEGVSAAKPGGQRRKRLSEDDWVHAAIEGLIADGVPGVRIARLARRLGVTPGSFYWHFRDRDQLRDRILKYWMDKLLRGVGATAQLAGNGAEQIRTLPELLLSRSLPELDRALRQWAIEDPAVASAMARANEARFRMVAAMFREAGLDDPLALQRAKLLAWAFRGSNGVDMEERLRGLQDLVEALLHDVEGGGDQALSSCSETS